MSRNEQALKDVRRKINEVTTKYASKVVVSQHTPETRPTLKEGEEWTDSDGKTWTRKNGTIRSVSKMGNNKANPWWCPKCGKGMSSKIDGRFHRIRGTCHECVLKREHQIRLDGRWTIYETALEMRNQLGWLVDKIQELTHYHDTLTQPEFRAYDQETGAVLMVDKFTIPLDKIKTDLTNEIELLGTVLENTETEYVELYGGLPGEENEEFTDLFE